MAWDYRVMKSRNRARTLYLHFHWRFRYFRLAMLLQKLALVLVTTFASSSTTAACGLMMAINFAFLGVAVRGRPYFNPASDLLNSAAAFACVVNPLLILLAAEGALDGASGGLIGMTLLTVNFFIPLLCLSIGLFYACKHVAKQQEVVRRLEAALSTEELKQIVGTRKVNDRELDKVSMSQAWKG